MADRIDHTFQSRGIGDAHAVMVMRGQATGGEAGFDLRARTVHQHQTHAEAVQQDQIVDDIAEIRMLDAVAGKHDDEGAIAVGIDVGRRVAKPIDVFGHEPGPVIKSSRKKGRNEKRTAG